MKIDDGKLVTLTYDLLLEGFDGELIESANEEKPLIFVFGNGDMLETFEDSIKDLKKGDEFKFSLSKDEAYGDISDDAIAEFPKDIFLQGEGAELPKVGDYVPMEDNEGNKFDGIASEIKKDAVVIDFNHPLAGEDLFFIGKVIDIAEADNKE